VEQPLNSIPYEKLGPGAEVLKKLQAKWM